MINIQPKFRLSQIELDMNKRKEIESKRETCFLESSSLADDGEFFAFALNKENEIDNIYMNKKEKNTFISSSAKLT